MFRAGPAFRQRKVYFNVIPCSVKIHVDEPALDLETLEHLRCHFSGLVIPAPCGVGVGREAEVERGLFGAVKEGRPTVSLAIPVAPQALGIDCDLIPAATHEQKIERFRFRGAMRAGGSDDLQEAKEDSFENFRGDPRYRKV